MKKLLFIILITCIPIIVFARQIQLFQKNLFTSVNLISYWRMEGNSNDTKGNNNGSDTAITYGTAYGIFGQGAGFNPASSSVISNTSPLLPTGHSALTINAWVYPTSHAGTNGDNMVMSWGTGATREMIALSADSASNATPANTISLYSYADDLDSTTTIPLNKWSMITGVYDGNLTLTLYYNGVLIGTHTLAAQLNITLTGAGMQIGHSVWDNTSPKYFSGYMDDVSMWNWNLTASQIAHLYTSRSLTTGISR